MTQTQTHRFPWWAYWLALAVITVFALAPLAGTLIAETVSALAGCKLEPTSVSRCMVFGMDWGNALYAINLLTWFSLITFPLAGGALAVWFVIIIIHRIAWRQMPKAN